MNSASDTRKRTLLAGVLAAGLFYGSKMALAHDHQAQSAIKNVVDFDVTTWAKLLKTGPRPAAYVFTNTFCATCPEAFEVLQQAITASGKKAALAAVLMDAQGQQALAHARHYVGATKLYAFDGFEPAIRQTVDPKWHNITPYIVLLSRSGTLQRVIGPPEAAQLKAWLA